MHSIQKNILQKISLSKTARYSDLKTKEIEGNLFVYHLNLLKKEGYIELKDKVYILTPKGKQLVGRVSFEKFEERIQPKIVTAIVLENKGKYLFYKQKRAPFIDKISFPYGKIHLEERLDEAAERELLEKSGLKADLKHRGNLYLTIHEETDLVSHMLLHIFTGKDFSGELKTDYPGGECFWSSIEDLPATQILPGVKHILKFLKKHGQKHFFEELFLNI